MNKNKAFGYIAITIVATIYGVSYMARNLITDTGAIGAPVITLLQLIIMAVLFGIYNKIKGLSMKVAGKDFPMLAMAGLFGTFVFHTLTNLSVQHAGANIPSLMFGLAAGFSLIISVVVYKKETNFLSWGAVAVGLVGLYFILGLTAENIAQSSLLGYGYSAASVLAWVIFCFLACKVSGTYETSVVLFWNAIVGVIASSPFLFFYPIDMAVVSANIGTIIVALIILGVFNATIAYFMALYAIAQIGVDMSNIFLNFMPIATMVAVFVVYGTLPMSNQVLGGLIIIASVFLLGYAESMVAKKQAARQKPTA